jgi:hypothetical protein
MRYGTLLAPRRQPREGIILKTSVINSQSFLLTVKKSFPGVIFFLTPIFKHATIILTFGAVFETNPQNKGFPR